VSQLHDEVKLAADPQGRGRQHLASQLGKLAGTRMAGFMLTRQAAPGKWGVATYALRKTGGTEDHRDHRGHKVTDAPYAPDADGDQDGNEPARFNKGTVADDADANSPLQSASEKTRWRGRL
jgi:hypothetical protein